MPKLKGSQNGLSDFQDLLYHAFPYTIVDG